MKILTASDDMNLWRFAPFQQLLINQASKVDSHTIMYTFSKCKLVPTQWYSTHVSVLAFLCASHLAHPSVMM